MKPTFIIAGVARCGSTSLFHYLKQHPEIGLSKIKEPKYFSSKKIKFPHNGPGDDTVDSKIIRNKNDYYALFSELSKFDVIGEASSDCFFYHEETIPAIKNELGDVKIILCFRNPIERAFSAYNNLIRDSRENLPFNEALKIESSRMKDNYDWMWFYKNGGLYSKGLKAFNDAFTNVKVVLLDEMESQPNEVLKSVFTFLEVDTNVKINVETKYSHSGKPKSKIIGTLTSRNNKVTNKLREIIINIVPRKFLEKIASRIFKKDDLSLEVRDDLAKYFKNDIEELEFLLDIKLKHWK